MAKQRTLYFVLPASFRPAEFLRDTRLHDDARYFISTILIKTARGQVDSLGVVRLHAKYLRNVMNYDHYSAVIDALLERGAIERFPYAVGQRSFGYRLAARFLRDKHLRVPVTDSRLIARLQGFYQAQAYAIQSRMLPVHFALDKLQHQLQIHGDAARKIIAAIPPEKNPYDAQGILVSDIEHREFHTTVSQYGRVFNNITSMKREVRKTLHVKGQRLASVDIRCAQPAFLARTIAAHSETGTGNGQGTGQREAGDGRGITEGDSQGQYYDAGPTLPNLTFSALCGSGQFYDFMVAQLAKRHITITRDMLKRKILSDVLAKRKVGHGVEYPSVVERCFRDLFPLEYRFIRRFNNDGWEHENLIRELQRQESKLVIETVAADLVSRHRATFFITLHDAIYVTPEHIYKVERAFERVSKFTELCMTLSIESAG